MEEKDFLISKKKDLIDSFYSMIWTGVRDWQKLVFQNILVLAWVGVLLKFGLEYKNGRYLGIIIFISQITIIWITIVVLEAGYWHRVVQIISTNIEKTFESSEITIEGEKKRIIPKRWQNPKVELPEIYKIHCAFLIIILGILTMGYTFWSGFSNFNKCFTLIDVLILITVVVGMFIIYWYWYCKRKKELEELKNSLSL